MIRLIFVILISIISFSGFSQKENQNITAKEGAKIQEKKKKEREEKAAAEYEKRKDQHESIQTKETRKRMKANRKRSQRHDTGYRPPFYKRWFGGKRRI